MLGFFPSCLDLFSFYSNSLVIFENSGVCFFFTLLLLNFCFVFSVSFRFEDILSLRRGWRAASFHACLCSEIGPQGRKVDLEKVMKKSMVVTQITFLNILSTRSWRHMCISMADFVVEIAQVSLYL